MKGHKPHSLEYFPVFLSSANSIIHYTCNSPSKKVLDKNCIVPLGEKFGCKDEREILEIPYFVYKKAGFVEVGNKNVLNLNLENLMRNLK